MADTNTWVLDLSSTPPNIYNSAVPEHTHNALQPPYPQIFWEVNQMQNDVVYSGELQYHSPCFESPYPWVFWYADEDVPDVVHSGAVEYHTPCLTQPYPWVFWFSIQKPDVTHNVFMPETPMGAFMNATNITSIRFPKTLQLLGDNVATYTAVTSVKIPSTCIWDEQTSFPDGCEIIYFD